MANYSNIGNHLSKEAAERLAVTISEYWQVHGYRVKTWTERAFNINKLGQMVLLDSIWCVRSDMVNGKPITEAAA